MPKDPESDTMRDEYDFSQGVRGKHAARLPEGARTVVLDPDVARRFPDAESVNKALRTLMRTNQP